MHIGPPKTGTSYLQSVLWASESALAAQGLVLPLAKRDHYHVALALRSISRPAAAARVATVLERLTAAADRVHDANLLITQEQLAPATVAEAQRLIELFRNWEVHVVITARDLGRQIPSGWQQGIKKRQTIRYGDYLDAVVHHGPPAAEFWRHQDLPAIATAWSSAVTPSQVHVVTVPPKGAAPTQLLDRFCEVIGVNAEALQTSGAVTNTSIGHAQAELLRLVNDVWGDALSGPAGSPSRAGQTYLAKHVLAAQAGPAPQLPRHLHEWCREESHRFVAAMEQGGYDVVGDLAELLPDFDGGVETLDVSQADVVRSAAAALANVVTARQQTLNELRTLQKRTTNSAGGHEHRRDQGKPRKWRAKPSG